MGKVIKQWISEEAEIFLKEKIEPLDMDINSLLISLADNWDKIKEIIE